MKNPIKIIFTILYRWACKPNPDSTPEWSAFVGVSVLLSTNLLCIYACFFLEGYAPKQVNNIVLAVLGVISFFYSYFLSIYDDKYIKIQKEPLFKDGKVWQSLLLWLYIGVTFYCLYLTKVVVTGKS
jgi:uncharacterized membrane protein (Fun14 family)